MICDTCQKETSVKSNGECYDCARATQEAWQARMSIRQDATKFCAQKLINILLPQHWMHEC